MLALKPDASILEPSWMWAWWAQPLKAAHPRPRGKVGVIGSTDAEGIAFEVRAFFPATTAWPKTP